MGKSFSKLKGDTEEIIHFGKKYKFTKVDKVVSTYLKTGKIREIYLKIKI